MPISAKYLKKVLGENFNEVINDTNEYLQPLGLHIYKQEEDFLLQFDLSEVNRSPKGILLYILMTTPLEGKNSIDDSWEYSMLTKNEKAILMTAYACSRKFRSDIFGIDNMKATLMPHKDKSLMTKGQFDAAISSLKRKHYLKSTKNKDMLRLGWRLKAEISVIEKNNSEELNDLIETVNLSEMNTS